MSIRTSTLFDAFSRSGLLVGVGDRFGVPVSVQHLTGKEQGLDHEVFALAW